MSPSIVLWKLKVLNDNDIFKRNWFTLIDVTNIPVESSANEIVQFIQDRFDIDERKIFHSKTE